MEGRPNESVKTLYTVDKDGFRINEYCHIDQWDTHVDPPNAAALDLKIDEPFGWSH